MLSLACQPDSQCHDHVIIQMHKSKNEPGSRSQMVQWINRTLNINQTKIQNLATGVVYCLLINHFHPGTIPHSKIIANPRSTHDYRINLRRLQEGLAALEVRNIAFDAFKISEMTYAENWTLICKLYRQFNAHDREKVIVPEQRFVPEQRSVAEQRWQPKPTQNKVETLFSKNHVAGSQFAVNHVSANPLSTPMKGPKMPEEGGKIRWQTMNTIQEIKRLVSIEGVTDRIKVGQLRHLLGLQDEEGAESQTEMKDLLSDYKKKEEVIQID